MLELKKCCKVPFPEKLFEEYEVTENKIRANVSASKVADIMKRFIKMHDEPLFFILELPCENYDDITESKIIHCESKECNVYYIDGLDTAQAENCIDALAGFLIKDGMNTFGIGGHNSNEEMLFGQYNVMTIYTRYAEKYHGLLAEYQIRKTNSLVTAWDTFDPEHPGECCLYVSEEAGKTIYDIPDTYKENGMYFYEKRSSDGKVLDEELAFDDLLGKILLVGITYYTHDNEFIEQKQFYGTVTQADEHAVCITMKNDTEFVLPPDLSSTKRARPGEYKLRSTGEVVVNPDFLATWSLIAPEDD